MAIVKGSSARQSEYLVDSLFVDRLTRHRPRRAQAKSALQVPDDFTVEAMAAVGKPGRIEDLPEEFQARESPNTRRSVSQLVFEGGYRTL
jgi:hypothetical protein